MSKHTPDSDSLRLAAEWQAQADALIETLACAIGEALDFSEDQSDIVDGSDGLPQANSAMVLTQSLQRAWRAYVAYKAAEEAST